MLIIAQYFFIVSAGLLSFKLAGVGQVSLLLIVVTLLIYGAISISSMLIQQAKQQKFLEELANLSKDIEKESKKDE